MTIKKYTNSELTISWEPGKCIHAEICVNTLPKVYNPKNRPWISINNATTKQLQEQISNCPSGALSYNMNNETTKPTTMEETDIQVKANGPLLISGNLQVTDAEGKTESKTNKTAFCRCGASNNKPYCDGTHSKIGFEG